MMRWPSLLGICADAVCQTASGSPLRLPGRRQASAHSNAWVCAHWRIWPSSARERGSTDTNRPPRAWMWAICSRVASFESAT